MRLDNFIVESSQIDPYEVVVALYNRSTPYIMELIREFHHIDLKTPMMLSGRKSGDTIINKHIRNDRYPKDTNVDAHNFVDDVFRSIYGINARSASIFATGRYNTANSYGDSVYGIFPNGTNYKIIWSDRINDLYSDQLDSGEYRYLGQDINEIVNDLLDSEGFYEDEARESLSAYFDSNNNRDDYEDEDAYLQALDEYVDMHYEDEARGKAEQTAMSTKENDEDSFIQMIKSDYREGDIKKAILSNNEIMLSGTSYTGIRYDYLPYVLRYMEVYRAKKPNPHLFASAMVGIDFRKFPNMSGVSQDTYHKRIAMFKITNGGIDMSDLKK